MKTLLYINDTLPTWKLDLPPLKERQEIKTSEGILIVESVKYLQATDSYPEEQRAWVYLK